jgi:uncharacterized membrane protein
MSFLLLMSFPTAFLLTLTRWGPLQFGLCDAMRWGMALGFLFTGVDHFVNAQSRYVPMIPELLQPHALAWVWLSGVAELAGAVGLLVPLAVWRQLGVPQMRRVVAVCISVMLVGLVWANINVAIQGKGVQGLEFGAWYFWLRPAFQPLFIAWVLFACRMIGRQPFTKSTHALD